MDVFVRNKINKAEYKKGIVRTGGYCTIYDFCCDINTWLEHTLDLYEYESFIIPKLKKNEMNISQAYYGECAHSAFDFMLKNQDTNIDKYRKEIVEKSKVNAVGFITKDDSPDDITWNAIKEAAKACYEYIQGKINPSNTERPNKVLGNPRSIINNNDRTIYIEGILDAYISESQEIIELKYSKTVRSYSRKHRRQVVLYCILCKINNATIINPVTGDVCIYRNVYNTWLKIEKKNIKAAGYDLNNKTSVLCLVKKHPNALEILASENSKFCDDEEIVLYSMLLNAYSIQFSSPRIKTDREFMLIGLYIANNYPTFFGKYNIIIDDDNTFTDNFELMEELYLNYKHKKKTTTPLGIYEPENLTSPIMIATSRVKALLNAKYNNCVEDEKNHIEEMMNVFIKKINKK